MPRKPKAPKTIATLKHKEAKRKNIPTAEYQSVMQAEDKAPVKVSYPRGVHGLEKEKDQRNRDLDPQLVWRGKDQQDWSDLVVNAPPLYIQEKVKPKVLIDDLLRESKAGERAQSGATADLFGDFNGLPEGADKTDFYHYEGNWQNRMILSDSLQVMASLAEREGLRGKCSASTSIRPTASSSTPTSSDPPPAARSRTATPSTSPASPNRSRPSATPGATASVPYFEKNLRWIKSCSFHV